MEIGKRILVGLASLSAILYADVGAAETPIAIVGGQKITCRALTGATYARGLAMCRKMLARYPGQTRQPAPHFAALSGVWVPGGPHAASRLYHLLLQGAFWRYLSFRLYQNFSRHYRPDIAPYVDLRNLSAAAALQAAVSRRYSAVLCRALTHGWRYRQLASTYRKAFPGSSGPGLRGSWPLYTANRGCAAAVYAFSAYPTGRESWQQLRLYNGLGGIALWCVMMQRLGYWTRRTNLRNGNLGVALLICPPTGRGASHADALVVGAFARRDGKYSLQRLAKCSAVLSMLGSPTQLGCAEWTLGQVRRRAGSVAFRKVVKWRRKLQVPDAPACLYVFQTAPPTFVRPTAMELAPGGFIYDDAKEDLLPPLARKLLGTVRLYRPLKPPTAGWLVGNFGSGVIFRRIFGVKIPEVIRRYPSTDGAWR